MGFYFSKSLKAGPFRFNFSKSGVGVSVGNSLFRVGTGPRGNYVRMGTGGFSYRATLPAQKKDLKESTGNREGFDTPSTVNMTEIESADISKLQDSSSVALLAEMNAKFKITAVQPFFNLLLVINILAYLYIVYQLNTPMLYVLIPVPFLILGSYWASLRDQRKKTVVLYYQLDETIEKAYQSLHDGFAQLVACHRKWHISASGHLNSWSDKKMQAGADTIVKRHLTNLTQSAPSFVSTNIVVPGIAVGKQTLYFFPDRVLVYVKGKDVGAVSYSSIQLDITNTRFIESSGVPGDATVVDKTWKYVNKKGGPDRRFKDNKEIPICLYSELYFQSHSGLNELIQLSKKGVGDNFKTGIMEMAAVEVKTA